MRFEIDGRVWNVADYFGIQKKIHLRYPGGKPIFQNSYLIYNQSPVREYEEPNQSRMVPTWAVPRCCKSGTPYSYKRLLY